MTLRFWVMLGLVGLLLQGCATDRPKVYPPAPVTPEYPVTLSWAKLHTPIGVDRYTWLVPAVDSGSVFVAERNGELSAFSLESGQLLWHKQTPYRFSAAPAHSGNVLYGGTSKAQIVAFQADSGKELWRQTLSSEVLVKPLVAGGRVIVRSNDGKVYGLDIADGKVIWAYDRNVPSLSLRGNSLPVVVGEHVIVGFANGRLVSLSLLDGKPNWETAVSLPRGRTELERIVDIDGPLVAQDGVVYAAAFNGKVAAVDAGTGSIFWARDISAYLGVMVAGDIVYLTDSGGKIWALNKESGATLWMQDKLAERAVTRSLPLGNRLVVGDALGELYWLAAEDGRLLGHLPYDKPAKMSGASWVIDELYDDSFMPQRRPDTAVIFTPIPVAKHLLVTYQNGVLASVSLPE